MHPRPPFPAQSSTRCFPFPPYLSLSLSLSLYTHVGDVLDGSFALNRLLLLLISGGGFSHRMEDASASSREAPLALSGPRGPHTCTRMCVRARAGTRVLHFLSPRLSFVRSFVRTFGPEEPMEGQQRQGKKTGRGRDLPHREAHLFWSRNFSCVPSAVTVTDIVFLSRQIKKKNT